MKESFLPLGRSGRESSFIRKIPGLSLLLRWIKLIFDSLILDPVPEISRPRATLEDQDTLVYTLEEKPQCVTEEKPSPGLILVKPIASRNEKQPIRPRKYFWGVVKLRIALLIQAYPRLGRWRELLGLRGPPRALFVGIDVVRLKE